MKKLFIALSLLLVGIIGVITPVLLLSNNHSYSQTKKDSELLVNYIEYIKQLHYKSKDVHTEDNFIYSVYENGTDIGLMEYSLNDVVKSEDRNVGSIVFLPLKGKHHNYIALKLNSSITESSYFTILIEDKKKKFPLNKEVMDQDIFIKKVDFDPNKVSVINVFNEEDIKILTLSR
ncbi:hypothetical protein [Metabacillus fastidiosus]|uniref:hypothetical protein n=1 Tax=Metabacillus fastidiosus TaxID=1458 RepID=UPI0008248AEE|nr:hypothetical protein [Metabacillus fastidiosus]